MANNEQDTKSQPIRWRLRGQINCSLVEQKLGTSLGPVLDAFSLGLSNKEVAELAELNEHDVQELRTYLGQVGSSLGLSFKKPICQQKNKDGKL
ncbi:MAG TPA: hypothetical protein VJ036_07985 [bacterium]|jgi:hypothetical protein|nr:hypothetical protein [bacterium]